MMLAALFWVSLVIVAYVYAGYPALLRIGAFGSRREWRCGLRQTPSVSVIVPAHNEEASIEAKIKSLLSSSYPPEQMEILIGSDGSSDRTEDIVLRYADRGIGLLSFPQQHGKSAIQNGLVAHATGEIIVFTDADCTTEPGTLQLLIDNFADVSIGLVTARPRFTNASTTNVTRNEGIYLRYETWLRHEESSRGILALASGSLFAMRRELWQPLDTFVGDDFALPLHVAKAGFRNVLDIRAVAVTRLVQSDSRSMFRMKMRIIAKDFRALIANCDLLNPFRHGGIAIALWSHKLLRWLVPYFLFVILASNIFLARIPFFRDCLVLQLSFYLLAISGLAFPGESRRTLFSIPASFCVVNIAALFGTVNCIAGRTFGRWTTGRTSSSLESHGELP